MKGCYRRLYWFFLIQQSHSDKARKYWRLRWALRVAVFLGEGAHCQTFFRHAASFSSETHSGICIPSGASIWNVGDTHCRCCCSRIQQVQQHTCHSLTISHCLKVHLHKPYDLRGYLRSCCPEEQYGAQDDRYYHTGLLNPMLRVIEEFVARVIPLSIPWSRSLSQVSSFSNTSEDKNYSEEPAEVVLQQDVQSVSIDSGERHQVTVVVIEFCVPAPENRSGVSCKSSLQGLKGSRGWGTEGKHFILEHQRFF